MITILKKVLSDLLAKEKLKSPPSLGSTIAFLFNKNIDQEKFFKDFVPAIQKIGNTAILNVEKVIALFGLTSSDVPPLLSLDYYANDLAISHEFVIFCGNWDCPNWTERILEQSNLVVIVESRDSPAHPLPNNIVNLIKSAGKIHLALLYDSCPKNYFSTSQWLKENRYPFSFEFAHNIVTSRKEDFGRLARILTGIASIHFCFRFTFSSQKKKRQCNWLSVRRGFVQRIGSHWSDKSVKRTWNPH